MKVASIQIPNSANAKNNLKAIEKGLALAAESRADLALFPECALTGFAARSDWSEDLMQHAFGKALKLCKKYRIGAVIPTSIRQNNSFYNGSIVVDTEGELIEVLCKRGLTSAEEAFFSVPQKKKRVFSFQGFRFALIFCREIEDAKELLGQESIDAILRPATGVVTKTGSGITMSHGQGCCKRWQAFANTRSSKQTSLETMP